MRAKKFSWGASSLPECVVASVILMTVFLLSLEILSRLSGRVEEQESVVALAAALQEGLRELDDGAHTEGNYTFVFGDIRVEASLTLYDTHIQQLVLTAWPAQGGSCVKRYHLIQKADEH